MTATRTPRMTHRKRVATMKSRWFRLLVIAGASGLAMASVNIGAAGADAPDAQGWWWRPQNSALPVALPAPPTAPADGLYVASDSTGAEAISAVRFTIPEGATTGSLTLKVAGNTVGTPILGMCPITGPWTPAQGGSWDQSPKFGDTSCASGTVSADGTSVSFTTSGLVSGGLLNVAIVPVKDATGGQPTFQMGFAKPDQTALTVTAASSSSDTPTDSGTSSYAASTAPVSSSSPSAVSSSPSTGSSSSSYTASAPVVPAVGEQSAAISDQAPQGADLVPSQPQRRLTTRPIKTSSSDNRKYQTIGIIGLAALATLYTMLNNRPARTAKALVAFGQISDDGDAVAQGGQA